MKICNIFYLAVTNKYIDLSEIIFKLFLKCKKKETIHYKRMPFLSGPLDLIRPDSINTCRPLIYNTKQNKRIFFNINSTLHII